MIVADGVVVDSGTGDGNPVDVPAGTYTVVVVTDAEVLREDVTVGEDKNTVVDLTEPGDGRWARLPDERVSAPWPLGRGV